MSVDVFDRVIKNAIDVMENSKYQIFEICENVRAEREALNKELQLVIEETAITIDIVDKFEVDYRRSRVRLTEVSRDFKRFNEEDIRAAYEAATQLQAQLAIHREKELHLKMRRDDLQKRLKNLDKQLERAEALVSQFGVVLEYLSGDLHQVTRLLESAKSRQLMGLKIILAQEEERKRIAREIHDGLAQNMANMVLRTEITERMLAKEAYSAVKEELADLKSGVRAGIEEVRKIIFNLRPMALDDLGLVPTLRKFVQDYEERSKISTKFELIGKEVRLPSGMEVAVYRLVQEAFSNVLKHAEASHITLELTFQQQMIKLTVTDNGVGFNTAGIDKKITQGSHYGLMGMRERVELLEGRFDIQSEVGAGTKVSMVIPIKSESKEE
ncbi:sensor histidine kinase [Paenibacillus mucilaginosus]|uniref:Signal transduction histidine-protein kinase/phosphatase DegS n=3 Tax=Paenibacillus mucilaginosus TaxID=61624 RepID=H6NT63_9BACL|nr:sensor histidine kinase [Paenibacillus mucilaginosus]AEI38744.1 histidine kinase [Paenibacillus mucilaginosus KNP414]AFC27076.1 histidine kinase [Paenibacillus mucilaginosus 3016]AFH59212.1 histidine kinase [Paenibacillus mucilaginosus K02]MCG7215878.1 sensor histidine kinase [Paenibacillus mucilaginosus]WDM27826.1 sensor histidine kinase [Paenibacillus mucilaginosus]